MSLSKEINYITNEYEKEVKTLYHKFINNVITKTQYDLLRNQLDEDYRWDIVCEMKSWYKV